MALHHNPRIVTNGLVLALDAADPSSYTSGSTTWYDLSGNNNDANLSLPFDTEYSFESSTSNKYFSSRPTTQLNENDPTDSSVWEVPYSVELSPTTGWTVCGYLNIAGHQTGNGTGWFHKAGNGDERGIHIEPISSNFRVNGASSWSHMLVNVSQYHNQWHYYSFVFNGTGTYGVTAGELTMYINGVQSAQIQNFLPAVDTTSIIRLGRRNGHFHHYLNGDISNYHYYTRALSTGEIKQNHSTLKSRFQ